MRWTTRRWLTGGLLVASVLVGGTGWMVLGAPGPDWLRWVLGAMAVLAASTAAMAVLLGPVARRMAGESHPLSAHDREQLTAKDRIDAVNTTRTTLLQAATGLVVVGGLLFTGAGLIYTARTLEVSAHALDATREGQITDRYTKAVEQLGSSKVDVRLGGIYALQRLAADSIRDKDTIVEVLVAYVRVHAQPAKSERVKGQAMVDVAAALNVISQLGPPEQDHAFNLVGVDLHGLKLSGVNLVRATLVGADLSGADLTGATLTRAELYGANLSGATLTRAYLGGATLDRANVFGADLTTATLTAASLSGATLSRATLTRANLTSANLSGATLTKANLTSANLFGATLTGADLAAVTGMTPVQIKEQATTDARTKFD